ncbi:co-chaperone [Dioszegia hungarica]|uniref:Tubulin-specific chaperone A n=1 Tax=Dioszegia hungarica TaxID=4972 RepID=A0AA38H2P8_9TREE|nr:co-chaperone [Dioszegia hungarica]KAI9631879.1 co-chaperone [Dioszegia hungarica]
MSDSTAQTTRQLKIKTGVVKRLFKEERTYYQEAEQARAKLQKMRDEDAEGADIRNAERVVKDSEQMIPRTKKSLDEAVVALEDLVDGMSSDETITATQEYKDAAEQLKVVKQAGTQNGA